MLSPDHQRYLTLDPKNDVITETLADDATPELIVLITIQKSQINFI